MSCQGKNIYEENIGSELEGIWTASLDFVIFYWIWTGNLLDSDL